MNYYNDNDQSSVAWLRELIGAGLIPAGDVDDRSIADVRPGDLAGYAQCHFFAGIGGWPQALALAGIPEGWRVWTGSCPCQPLSSAGLRRGHADGRHLWPAFFRLISECRPPIVFGEQVAGSIGREWLAGVRADLEGVGYAVGASDLCAAGVGAPHIRQRLYWGSCGVAYMYGKGLERRAQQSGWQERSALEQSGGSGRVGDTQSDGRDQARCDDPGDREKSDRTAGNRASHAGSDGGLGDSVRGRFEVDQKRDSQPNKGPTNGDPSGADVDRSGFWDRYDVIAFRDGKFRRVESGTFPLANGVPGRVGLLRGYGNAIVPPLAAKFVASFVEAIRKRAS